MKKLLLVAILSLIMVFSLVTPALAADAWAQYYKTSGTSIGGISASITTPPMKPVGARGTIKACLATVGKANGVDHLLELGWIYRPEWSYPKTYYIYEDSYGRMQEVLLGNQAWNKTIRFEIRVTSELANKFYLNINGNTYATKRAIGYNPMGIFGAYAGWWNRQIYFIGARGSDRYSVMWAQYSTTAYYYPNSDSYGTASTMDIRTLNGWYIDGKPSLFYTLH